MAYGVHRLRGDHGSQRGDPIFGALAGVAGSLIGGVVRKVAGAVVKKAPRALATATRGVVGSLPSVGTGVAIGRLTASRPGSIPLGPGMPRRRRMNPGNSKALNRAIRRVNSFASLVKRSKKSIAKANTAVGNRPRTGMKKGARR